MPAIAVSEKCSIVVTAIARGDGSNGGWVAVGDDSRWESVDNYWFDDVPFSQVVEFANGYIAACMRFVVRPDGSPVPVRLEVVGPQVAETAEFRPMRFFCTVCHKELWEGAKLEDLCLYTLGELLNTLICTDCALSEDNIPLP